ncbi:thioesterase family protein [Prescottella sp. R16]|uniref:thioesterase family protein n=1 Tax=Prescottella sp. R16 TaxID=3064529 RepID=UPI00272DE63B|nr:thioesterase family protein [Prescottella sp. R16]
MHYFERLTESTFLATSYTGGAWNTEEQHVAPALGLLAHVVETDRDARRGDGLSIGRISYDILGTLPIGEVETSVRVLRAGRTIELVEATLSHGGRAAVVARAWLMQAYDTEPIGGTSFPGIAAPDAMPAWDATTVWPGGFIASAEIRRDQVEPGRASFWVRTPVALVGGEKIGPVARTAGLLDIANGMTTRISPVDVAFPNLDLTLHLFAEPQGEWVGFDTTVSFGASGVGLTHSVVSDEKGPIGTSSQILTVRPTGSRGAAPRL